MFLVLLIFAILIVVLLNLKLSLMILVSIDEKGFHLNIKVMLYKILTLYSWRLEEGGLSFLLKKKKDVPEKKKKKKGLLAAVTKMFFSTDTYNHLKKNLEVFDLSVTGRLATKNAAVTAQLFGGIWSILGMLIPIIPQKHFIFDFYPDFQKEKSDFHISCILRVRIIHIIVLIVNYLKEKMGKGREVNYGTASN